MLDFLGTIMSFQYLTIENVYLIRYDRNLETMDTRKDGLLVD